MSAKPLPPGATSGAGRGRAGRMAVRGLIGAALLLALFGALHALLWRWMGSQLEDGFAAWAAHDTEVIIHG